MTIPVKGQVIELLEDSQIISAVVVEERKGKLRLLSESGRELHASAKQVVQLRDLYLDLNQAREGLIRTLQSCAARRIILADQVDIPGLWELLQEEEGEFSAADLADLAFSDVSHDQVAAVLTAVYRDRVYFRSRGAGLFRATDSATVTAILTQRARETEKATRTRRISEWLRAALNGQHLPTPPEGIEIIELLKDVALNGPDAPSHERVQEILRILELEDEAAPFQLLVRLGAWSPDENLMLLRLDTRRVFPPDIQEATTQILALRQWQWQEEPRRDCTQLAVYAVDNVTTQDVDDAVSLTQVADGFELGIHITDVAAFIAPDSRLDSEARLRATSIYLPDLLLPMLPFELSADLLSLQPGLIRPALSLFLNIDPDGAIRSWRFAFSVVRVQRATYAEVDAFLLRNETLWAELLKIAQAWRAERWSRGALFLTFPEISVHLGTDGAIAIERQERESPAHLLVSEMMIKFNQFGALALSTAGVPALYRGQAASRERLFEGVVADDLWLNYRQRMLLARAETATAAIIHHGLGVDTYATLSSPLRRYADLVNQRQLSALLRDQPYPYTGAELETIRTTLDRPVSNAALLEQNRRRYWILRFLETRRGYETDALILGINGNRLQLTLPEFMLETLLSLNSLNNLLPGRWLRVRITRVQALADILRIELASRI